MRYKLLSLLLLFITCCSKERFPSELKEDFSFEMSWGMAGDCYYNSKTGFLTKVKHLNEEKYNTSYFLKDYEREASYQYLKGLKIDRYPDTYEVNPKWINRIVRPCHSLFIKVETSTYEKQISVPQYVVEFGYENKKAMDFIETLDHIKNFLLCSDEWRNLPELDFGYE